MKRQPRVVWTKGMFLSPQHFQAQDLYFEDLIQSRFSASHFANYGVTGLEIDADAVANGLFKLTGARGVLPDGEFFDMPASDELPPSRQFARHWPTADETLEVYLSLPERRLNARNVTLPGQRDGSGPADTRYTSEARLVPDDNQGSDERPVQVGKKTFRLLFGTEFRDGYSSLRIARLERSGTGRPMLRSSFVAALSRPRVQRISGGPAPPSGGNPADQKLDALRAEEGARESCRQFLGVRDR